MLERTPPSCSLSSYGDEAGDGNIADLTAVPEAAIRCLGDLYELNLLGNAITTIPLLGTNGLRTLLLPSVSSLPHSMPSHAHAHAHATLHKQLVWVCKHACSMHDVCAAGRVRAFNWLLLPRASPPHGHA